MAGGRAVIVGLIALALLVVAFFEVNVITYAHPPADLGRGLSAFRDD